MARNIQLLTALGLAAAVGFSALSLRDASVVTAAKAASPIEAMAGYWSGTGSVALSGGKSERVKCSVTYKVSSSGSQIKQNMRCASTDYKIDAAADLRIQSGNVSGTWEEKTYSANGQVSGRVAGNSMNLTIKGEAFSAGMNLSTSDCKQTINITPKGLDVTRIQISLAKC